MGMNLGWEGRSNRRELESNKKLKDLKAKTGEKENGPGTRG